MYSEEEREKAIKLYIKYDKCTADVIHELGYLDRKTLTGWYKVVNHVSKTSRFLNTPCLFRKEYAFLKKLYGV